MSVITADVGLVRGKGVDPRMVFIPGGTFRMGSDRHYPEEAPSHRVRVNSFWIDATPVTNRQFKEFVTATGQVTFAEIPPDPEDYPGALPEMLYAGSLTFTPPKHLANAGDWSQWWQFLKGADWRHPYGPRSNINVLDNHPVVHIAYSDALAYANWAGKDLPTEAEWEFAARGGLDEAEYAWGDEFTPGGRHMANTWQGEFPLENLNTDGFARTSPVRTFPANGHDVYDMIGNVWEWTSDWYVPKHEADANKACCIPANPRGPREQDSYDPCQPDVHIPRKVLKGGSHLCAPNYCRRSSRRASCGADRHIDKSCRISVCHAHRGARMTSDAPSTTARAVAWAAVITTCAFIALGLIWYGFSAESYSRLWRDVMDRPGGPFSFRFILQPIMALIAALHDGVKDARLNRAPYFWTVLSDRTKSAGRLREGIVSTARIILLGLGMDAIYQNRVLDVFYPGEAALVAVLLAFIPYLLLRGPIARIARRWTKTDREVAKEGN
jgi:sulfatase modifying factor 1